jgi:hypothetical protein
MTEPTAPLGTTTTLPAPSVNGSAPPRPAPRAPARSRMRTKISGMRTGLIAGAVLENRGAIMPVESCLSLREASSDFSRFANAGR